MSKFLKIKSSPNEYVVSPDEILSINEDAVSGGIKILTKTSSATIASSTIGEFVKESKDKIKDLNAGSQSVFLDVNLEAGGIEVEEIINNNSLRAVNIGDVSGAVALDLAIAATFVMNTTNDITLSFTNVPASGVGIVLDITGTSQVNFPAGANASGGSISPIEGTRNKYILTVRSANDYDVDGLISDIQSV